MERLQVYETFLAQGDVVILAGVAGRQIGVRGLQFTIDKGPGAGGVAIFDGPTAVKVVDFGDPSDPAVFTLPITSDSGTFWGKTSTGNGLVLSWSYPGAGSVWGTLLYEWIVDPSGHIGNA